MIKDNFLKRNYPEDILSSAFNSLLTINRIDTLKYKTRKDNLDNAILIQ